MAPITRTSKLYIFLFLAATAGRGFAQQPPAQPSQPGQTAAPPATPTLPPPLTAPDSSQSQTPALPPPPQPPPKSPYDSSDSQFSLELFYWRTTIHPNLRTGAANQALIEGSGVYPSVFDFPGNSTNTPGAELSIPAGRYNTIRVSYFRTKDTGSTTENNNVTLFGTNYAPGNFLTTSYLLQNLNLTYDYLTWPWPPRDNKFLFKTRYGIQYTNISSSLNGPFLATTDDEGNAIATTATGSHRLIYPTLGVGFEYLVSKHFRVEMNASGFAFPHRAVTWNGDGFLAYRLGHVEVVAGGKALHFKTSPKGPEYFIATPYGAYVGLRFYVSSHP